MNHEDFDIFTVGGGSFVQFFRDDKINPESITSDILDLIKQSVYTNFKNYLFSDEPKDEKLLIPLICTINSLKKNKTFENNQFNLIVFEEKNETIRIIEPYGKFQFKNDIPWAFIYKQIDKFEPLIYHYSDINYGYIPYISDQILHKGDDILFLDTIAKIIKISKDQLKISLKDTDEVFEIEKESIHKYDMKSIIDIVLNFIQINKSKQINNEREYITEEDAVFIMTNTMKMTPLNKGYYDTYNRLAYIEYKEVKDRKIQRFLIPIKPKSLSDKILQHRILLVNKMPKISLNHILIYLKKLDKIISREYPDKYATYLDGNEKIPLLSVIPVPNRPKP